MTLRRPGEAEAGNVAGCSLMIAETTSACVVPVKGGLPLAISYSSTPSAQMSLRAVAASPLKTSGAM